MTVQKIEKKEESKRVCSVAGDHANGYLNKTLAQPITPKRAFYSQLVTTRGSTIICSLQKYVIYN
jgi:hypothetical protein